MNDRSGFYGLLGILVLLGVSVWGINHEPMKVKVAEAAPSIVAVVHPKPVEDPRGDGPRTQWEALTAEVEGYHAKGTPAPLDLLRRQMAAFVRVQEQLRREQLALNGELEQMAASR